MKPDPSLRQQTTTRSLEETAAAAALQSRSGVEFASTEELLRHDRAQIPVPERLEQRVADSLGRAAPAPVPWWKRWL